MKPEEPELGHKIQDVAGRESINNGAEVQASFSPDFLAARSNTVVLTQIGMRPTYGPGV